MDNSSPSPSSPFSATRIDLNDESRSLLKGGSDLSPSFSQAVGTPQRGVELSPGMESPIAMGDLPTYDLESLLNHPSSSVIAEGGYGKVFQCRAETSLVAVKTGASIRHEVATLQLIQNSGLHSNIIPMLGIAYGRCSDGIVLELMTQDLQTVLRHKKRLTLLESRHLLKSISQGLAQFARLNITHGDLKPSNILLKRETIKIADFGSANTVLAVPKSTTQGYRTPEALIGVKKSGRCFETDQWCLGVLFLECLLGENPFNFGSLHALWSMCCTATGPFPHPIHGVDPEESLPFYDLSLKEKPESEIREHLAEVPLLADLLHLQPAVRPSPFTVLANPFYKEAPACNLLHSEVYEEEDEDALCVTPPRAGAGSSDITPPGGSNGSTPMDAGRFAMMMDTSCDTPDDSLRRM